MIEVQKNTKGYEPYSLLTTIHGNNRFNDLQSSLTNVLISLKTYENKYDYLEHFRFRQYRFKGLDTSQKQEVFGLAVRVKDNERYVEGRKKMKEIIAKLRLEEENR